MSDETNVNNVDTHREIINKENQAKNKVSLGNNSTPQTLDLSTVPTQEAVPTVSLQPSVSKGRRDVEYIPLGLDVKVPVRTGGVVAGNNAKEPVRLEEIDNNDHEAVRRHLNKHGYYDPSEKHIAVQKALDEHNTVHPDEHYSTNPLDEQSPNRQTAYDYQAPGSGPISKDHKTSTNNQAPADGNPPSVLNAIPDKNAQIDKDKSANINKNVDLTKTPSSVVPKGN